MNAQLVICQRCGKEAVVHNTLALLNRDYVQQGVKSLHVIECSLCGWREQPVDVTKS